MLTNPFETQMVRGLGVNVGRAPAAAEPFQHLRGTMADVRVDTVEGALPVGSTGTGGGACPFAAMLNQEPVAQERAAPSQMAWTSEAEARIERIPSFIRPMARKAIERYAEGKGYAAITEDVMAEAREALGM
jgi:hypothetical protein